jgi:uncharacterized protein (DUF1810 family)
MSLERFRTAQTGVYERATAELRAGRKQSHWMWFVFPQVAGLGLSINAQVYAIASLDEARVYLADDILGPRLRECAAILTGLDTTDAEEVFGEVDAMKLRSSMTLFARAAAGTPDEKSFTDVLDHYFGGVADAATHRLLAR